MAFVIQHRYSPFLGVSGIVGTGVRRLRNQCPAKIGTGVRLKSEWVSGRRRNTHAFLFVSTSGHLRDFKSDVLPFRLTAYSLKC